MANLTAAQRNKIANLFPLEETSFQNLLGQILEKMPHDFFEREGEPTQDTLAALKKFTTNLIGMKTLLNRVVDGKMNTMLKLRDENKIARRDVKEFDYFRLEIASVNRQLLIKAAQVFEIIDEIQDLNRIAPYDDQEKIMSDITKLVKKFHKTFVKIYPDSKTKDIGQIMLLIYTNYELRLSAYVLNVMNGMIERLGTKVNIDQLKELKIPLDVLLVVTFLMAHKGSSEQPFYDHSFEIQPLGNEYGVQMINALRGNEPQITKAMVNKAERDLFRLLGHTLMLINREELNKQSRTPSPASISTSESTISTASSTPTPTTPKPSSPGKNSG